MTSYFESRIYMSVWKQIFQKIFGLMRDDVGLQFRKLNSEEFRDLSSHIVVRIVKYIWACARMRETRNGYAILVVKSLVKRPLMK
jgi:hypothetical protein